MLIILHPEHYFRFRFRDSEGNYFGDHVVSLRFNFCVKGNPTPKKQFVIILRPNGILRNGQGALGSFSFPLPCLAPVHLRDGRMRQLTAPWRTTASHIHTGACEGGRTLRKDVFLPSKHLLGAFYKTLPSKNPSKNLVFAKKPFTGAF